MCSYHRALYFILTSDFDNLAYSAAFRVYGLLRTTSPELRPRSRSHDSVAPLTYLQLGFSPIVWLQRFSVTSRRSLSLSSAAAVRFWTTVNCRRDRKSRIWDQSVAWAVIQYHSNSVFVLRFWLATILIFVRMIKHSLRVPKAVVHDDIVTSFKTLSPNIPASNTPTTIYKNSS